ncbi:family 16 glycosylhydrolase [Mesorhizobium sp. 1B3]|uniref:glycoside hydrolase family 16 protein n=1 Tax=Mesorhizobium sp. 1B3 TaxID=3243599 RepID=UPI003D95ECDB
MASVANALGVLLPYSGPSSRWLSAADSGPTLLATPLNDSLYGGGNGTVTMWGLAGDDIYNLYSTKDQVFEQPGEGIDTIITWMSYTLPENFENLTVTGDRQIAIGNDQDNIISGRSAQQTLDGGAGNDVLIGGDGADIFSVKRGNGSDVILDFNANDIVRLDGYGFTSFDQVKANMFQSGIDVTLGLADGEVLVFANKTIEQLHADQFKLGLDKSNLRLTFADEFDSLSLWNGQTGTWDTNYWWGAPNGSTLPDNKELEWYIDTDYRPTKSVNPFSVEDGVLTITAARAPEEIRPFINNYEYTSGMITSFESFSQTYGYFEIRADMPDTQGTWPAFWLLPADGTWPPELDVIEMRGQNPNQLVLTAHSEATGEHTQIRSVANVSDTEGFHTYGLLWTQNELVWYFDDVEVARAETPPDMHDPMYMIANMGLGGWAGTPADGLATPAEMKIDYIHAYQLGDDAIL